MQTFIQPKQIFSNKYTKFVEQRCKCYARKADQHLLLYRFFSPTNVCMTTQKRNLFGSAKQFTSEIKIKDGTKRLEIVNGDRASAYE